MTLFTVNSAVAQSTSRDGEQDGQICSLFYNTGCKQSPDQKSEMVFTVPECVALVKDETPGSLHVKNKNKTKKSPDNCRLITAQKLHMTNL